MKFIIISRQRSGTGLLRTYLKSHPELDCIVTELPFMKPEQFNKYVDFDKVIKPHIKPKIFKKKIVSKDNKGIDDISKNVNDYNKKTFPIIFYKSLPNNIGFDTKYDSISIDSDLNNVNIIHLIRKNTFKQAISKWIENFQHISHRPTRRIIGDPPISNEMFEVNENDIKRMIKRLNKEKQMWKKKLSNPNYNVLTLYYEDIIDKTQTDTTLATMPEKKCKKLCKFLDISYAPMTSDRIKVNSSDYESYIKNWNQIKKLE